MQFYFCEKCGKRVLDKDIEEGRGKDKKLRGVYCDACSVGVLTMETMPLSDEEAREIVKSSESSTTTKGFPRDSARRSTSSRQMPSAISRRKTGLSERSAGATPQVKKGGIPIPVIAGIGVAVLLGLVFVFAGGRSPKNSKTKKSKTKTKNVAAKATAPVQDTTPEPVTQKPAGQPEIPPQTAKGPATPVPVNTNVPAPTPVTPTPTPAVAPAPVPEPEKQASNQDPVALRARLGRRPSRDDIQRLSELPPPNEPEKVFYSHSFDQGLKDWRRDYGSKAALTDVAGERAFRVEKGKGRDACFSHFSMVINNTRVRMRVYQKNNRKMQLSVMSPYGIRFGVGFPLPADSQWTDVEVDISKAKAGKIGITNLPIKHIEVHGWPSKGKESYFAISRFEIITGGGAAAPAPKSTEAQPDEQPAPPANVKIEPPPPPVQDEKGETRAAFAVYEDALHGMLRKRDVTNARSHVEKAMKQPELAELKAELEYDLKSLAWPDQLDELACQSLFKANDLPSFELKMTQGKPIRVGKKEKNKIQSVEQGKILVGNKAFALPVPLENLHRDTLDQLALLGLKKDANGLVRRAWLRTIMTDFARKRGEGRMVRATIDRAKATGASDADVKFLKRRLQVAEHGALELAAKEAWEEAQTRANANDWKLALAGLKILQKAYARTRFYASKTKEIDALFTKAEDHVGKAEGYHFDFDSEGNYNRFMKRFHVTGAASMKMLHEPGALIFRQEGSKPAAQNKIRTLQVRSSALRLGENWDVEYRVNIGMTPKKLSSGHGEGVLNLSFISPGAKANLSSYGDTRFHLGISAGHGGFFCHALRGRGQSVNGWRGSPGVFTGMKGLGGTGGGWLAGGKAKPPASTDGWYEVLLRRRGEDILIVVNGKQIVNGKLPKAAAARIAASPITLLAGASGFVKEVRLDRFVYRDRN